MVLQLNGQLLRKTVPVHLLLHFWPSDNHEVQKRAQNETKEREREREYIQERGKMREKWGRRKTAAVVVLPSLRVDRPQNTTFSSFGSFQTHWITAGVATRSIERERERNWKKKTKREKTERVGNKVRVVWKTHISPWQQNPVTRISRERERERERKKETTIGWDGDLTRRLHFKWCRRERRKNRERKVRGTEFEGSPISSSFCFSSPFPLTSLNLRSSWLLSLFLFFLPLSFLGSFSSRSLSLYSLFFSLSLFLFYSASCHSCPSFFPSSRKPSFTSCCSLLLENVPLTSQHLLFQPTTFSPSFSFFLLLSLSLSLPFMHHSMNWLRRFSSFESEHFHFEVNTLSFSW